MSNLSNLIGTNVPFTPTSYSGNGIITAVATDYTLLPANTTRRFLLIQVLTGTMYVVYQGTSAYSGGNYLGQNIIAGDTVQLDVGVPNTAIHISSPIAGSTYYILEG